MSYKPRTIALFCDLLHAPLAPDARAIQRYHNELFEAGEPAYSSFSATPAGPVLANNPGQPGAVSQAIFLPDRIQIREELGPLTPEEFASRARSVAEGAAPHRGVQNFLAQSVAVRVLINPKNYKDARSFLRDGMFAFAAAVEDFERDPQLYGLRLAFPPDPASGDAQQPAFNLRIESYARDPRSLFLECQGTFGPVVALGAMDAVQERVLEVQSFVLRKVLPFVARFDAPQAD